MRTKKLLSGVVAVTMAATVLGTTPNMGVFTTNVFAEQTTEQKANQIETGKCGDNVVYKFDLVTKDITISGTGDMWDDCGAFRNMYEINNITIDEGVTSVGENSFDYAIIKGKVTIANTVSIIKRNAFGNIESELIIPESVKKIETSAFIALYSIEIMGDVDGFDPAIVESGIIEKIILHGSATNIGKVFTNNIIDKVILSAENKKCTLEKGCIMSTDKTKLSYFVGTREEVEIPDTVTTIEDCAFKNKYVNKVKLGTNVTTIGEEAFYRTRSLTTFITNKKLKTVKDGAFAKSEIRKIVFAGKVTLGKEAFKDKTNITYSKGIKKSQTTVTTANLIKRACKITFAKISDANGYEVKFINGKKSNIYTTKKKSFSRKFSSKEISTFNITNAVSEDGSWTAGYVTVRPYKIVKNKKVYGRWSAKMLLNYYE